MDVKLLQPTPAEVSSLLRGAITFRSYEIVEAALPPRVILDQSRHLLSATPLSYRWSIPFLVLEPAAGAIVGSIGGKGLLAEDTDVELGYNVAPTFRQRGIATAAVALITHMSLADGLCPLAHVEPWNVASIRALIRNGYHLECSVRMPAGFRLDRYRWSADEH